MRYVKYRVSPGVITCIGLIACNATDPVTPLASLQGDELFIERSSSQSWECVNWHEYCDTLEISIIQSSHASSCPILSANTVATIDHVRMPGSLGRLDHGLNDTKCFGASFRLDHVGSVLDENEAVTTFTLSDESATVRFSAQNLLAMRNLHVSSPLGTDNHFHRGEVVTLEWSPSTDTLAEPGQDMVFQTRGASSYEGHAPKHVVRQGSTVSFDVPTDVMGEGHFVMWQPATPRILECAGPLSCKAYVGNGFDLAATIIP